MTRTSKTASAAFLSLALLSRQAIAQPATQPQSLPPPRPQLTFQSIELQQRIAAVYQDALHNLLDINTRAAQPGHHNPIGRMQTPPGTFIRAGGAYDQPWSRDASLNSWFAGSLLEPVTARNTLWAVCQRQPDGSIVVQRDNQWWDQCIWVTAAWNHYLVTGDHSFLQAAYPVATATLESLRREHFNPTYGLFMGPAFFADGIAAYPEPQYDPANPSSFVLDHRHTSELMALSTNCVYRNAYRCAAQMARALSRPQPESTALDDASDALKAAINRHLWSPDRQTYAYFIPAAGPDAGKPFPAQEGTGLSFAILFDIADAKQTAAILRRMHAEPKGIPTLWPNLPQFDDNHPGRHNVMIWPMVNGLWATAAARSGATDAFATEINHMTDLVLASNHNFYEIYHPRTGLPDGGWQVGRHWDPLGDQTWSATAYIAAIHSGLFGLSFQPNGLHLTPNLPPNWSPVELAKIPYRQMTLSIRLTGQGTHITQVTLDGAPLAAANIPSHLTGFHEVEIHLE